MTDELNEALGQIAKLLPEAQMKALELFARRNGSGTSLPAHPAARPFSAEGQEMELEALRTALRSSSRVGPHTTYPDKVAKIVRRMLRALGPEHGTLDPPAEAGDTWFDATFQGVKPLTQNTAYFAI